MKPQKLIMIGSGGFVVWRLYEQKQLKDQFIAAGVASTTAKEATSVLMPFFSTVTFNDIAGDQLVITDEETIGDAVARAPLTAEEWQGLAEAAFGGGSSGGGGAGSNW